MVYNNNSLGELTPKSYCTISESLEHGPPAIWCHLQPVLSDLPNAIDTLHFLSDGPATQYKNKTMFYILGSKIKVLFPNLAKFTWNYFESGRGNGAADGIGAVCKRTADRCVAQGKDVASFDTLFTVLTENCPKVHIYKIFDHSMREFESKLNKEYIKPYISTMKVHQVSH